MHAHGTYRGGCVSRHCTLLQAGHKLLKIGIQKGQEIEIVTMIIECCSQVMRDEGAEAGLGAENREGQ
jgi:hypothetical protein